MQSLKIRFQQLCLFADGAADKAAITASGGAEGDAHIEGNVRFFQQTGSPDGGLRAVYCQLPPVWADIVGILQQPVGGFGRTPLQQMPGGDLGGANPGQSPPGGRGFQQLTRRQIVALLQNPATQTHRLPVGLQPAGGGGGFSVQGDFRRGCEPGAPPVEGGQSLSL